MSFSALIVKVMTNAENNFVLLMHGNLISTIACCFDYIANSKMKSLKCLHGKQCDLENVLLEIFIPRLAIN